MPLVALDLDGTLVDQITAARAWVAEFVAARDLPATVADDIAAQLAQRRPKGDVFDSIVSTWSLPISGAELWSAYRRRMPELVQCSDADKQALRDLRAAGWTLGIVTNGMTDNQEGKIRSTGLSELVDGWVISEEVGHRKPEPQIFAALANRLGCKLEGWMIGDSIEHAVAGGAAVGLSTALIASPGIAPKQANPSPAFTAPTVAVAVAAIVTERTTDGSPSGTLT